MRRTMGISAHLYSEGISPARVKVNLLNSQVEIPKPLRDFKGIIVAFSYNQPINLVVESPIGDSAGPPLSLGTSPSLIDPSKGEGTIVEFSVQEPSSGLVSWKFQLLQPSEGEDELSPLQEVRGGGPVFHQIYWNGRKNYFGAVLPPGRYECVLTATDGKNRQRTLHRWIQLPDSPLARKAPGSARESALAGRKQGAPAAELGEAVAQPLLSGARPAKTQPVDKSRKTRRARRAAAPKGAAKKSSPGTFLVEFAAEQAELSEESGSVLGDAAKASQEDPESRIELMGYSHSAEPEAEDLAKKRAQAVAGALINQYKVEPGRIQVRSTVAETPVSQVRIKIGAGES